MNHTAPFKVSLCFIGILSFVIRTSGNFNICIGERNQAHVKCPANNVTEIQFREIKRNGCRMNGLKIAVIQLATEKAHWSAAHAHTVNLMYSRRHSYDFISLSCPYLVDPTAPISELPFLWDPVDQVRANWAKPSILMNALDRYDIALLLDSDAYISDPSFTIEELVQRYLNFDEGCLNAPSILVPLDCTTVKRDEDANILFKCFGTKEPFVKKPGLNIAVMIAINTSDARDVLELWSNAVHIKTSDSQVGCKDLVYPEWQSKWSANDQRCLNRLYNANEQVRRTIKVLSFYHTFYLVAGFEHAWITHWFGGSSDMNVNGEIIKKSAVDTVSQNVYQSFSDTKTVNIWNTEQIVNCADGGCFDVFLLYPYTIAEREETVFLMFLSHAPTGSIMFTNSIDGIDWSHELKTAVIRGTSFSGDPQEVWDYSVSQPYIFRHDCRLKMWFTGHSSASSSIGYAESDDGVTWKKRESPVFVAEMPWENGHIECSQVLYDRRLSLFRMWYGSRMGGIGHAVSCDGIQWNRTSNNPIFASNKNITWEKYSVTCPTIVYNGEYYFMFYSGSESSYYSAIGIARSRDGITSWERQDSNPIITSSLADGEKASDFKVASVSKLSLAYAHNKWVGFYSEKRDGQITIRLVTRDSHDLF